MRETRTETKQVHFMMGKRVYETLRSRAQEQEVPVSHLLRRYTKRGMADDKFVENGGTIIYRSKDGKNALCGVEVNVDP